MAEKNTKTKKTSKAKKQVEETIEESLEVATLSVEDEAEIAEQQIDEDIAEVVESEIHIEDNQVEIKEEGTKPINNKKNKVVDPFMHGEEAVSVLKPVKSEDVKKQRNFMKKPPIMIAFDEWNGTYVL